ncbi:MAG: DUF882 domain-containing protein [Rhodocyclaceae bacterium]|jgi:uncharacterized protein YcbK (DUF882 family)|nr:DUF882 domain-containing protein [Rhodocyclaceae bacterium]
MPNFFSLPPCPRRRLLLKGLGALPLGLGYTAARARTMGDCQLSFRHTHTDERLQVVYRSGGQYQPAALAEVNHLLRDFRTGQVSPIDPALLDILHALGGACGGQTFEIISGYRSPATNGMLKKTGGGGVATHSLHMEGRAIDVRMPGVDTARLRDAALALGLGGVGYYPAENFLHVDTGRVRAWGPRAA